MRHSSSLLVIAALGALGAACSAESAAEDSPANQNGSGSVAGSGALAGTGASSATGGASSGGSGPGVGGSGIGSGSGSGGSSGGALSPVSCADPFENPADYTSGLPLLTSNPGAGLVLFVDYDGGSYDSTSYAGYYTGSATERENIVKSFNYLTQYFAMFDLSVTTDPSKIGAGSGAQNWGWIVVTPDYSGGVGKYDGIGQNSSAKAVCSSTTMTSTDRSRRIAHELGHNMNLYHDGLFENGTFCKFEDCSTWDGKYGSIMGGGGEGERNGWGLALYDPDHGGSEEPSNLQDEMAKVRIAVRELGGSTANDGWSTDDHPDAVPSPLCIAADQSLYRIGVLNRPDDVDVFSLDWSGGDLKLSASAPGVSAALVELDIYLNGAKVGDDSLSGAAAGAYEIRVKSTGEYGAIGYYEIHVQ